MPNLKVFFYLLEVNLASKVKSNSSKAIVINYTEIVNVILKSVAVFCFKIM